MTVARVLDQKGAAVVTIAPDHSLREAADVLAKHRIGALVISRGGGTVEGILSERDIVRAIARDGEAALDRQVEDYMTRKVVTCRREHRIIEVMEMMTAGKFRHVPVVDREALAGMISIGDVVKHRLAELETESRSLREYIAMA